MAKELGNYAEVRFMAAAFKMDFNVSRPFCEKGKYDFIIEKGGRCIRVQVKSTSTNADQYGRFIVLTAYGRPAKHLYTKKDADIMAIYIERLDCFYLIPVELITTKKVSFFPSRETCKFVPFKENWNLCPNP